jgi:hypothetical protein
MKSTLARLLVSAATLLLMSCASMLGSRDIEVPLSSLQASLDRRFPLNNRVLEIFDINVSSPRIMLQPETNRLVTTMDAVIAPPFMKNAWRGSFTLSGMLAIDQMRHAVILADPRVESININGVEPAYSRQVTRIGALMAEQIFRDLALYKFNPEDFRYAGVPFLPTKINARSNALVVTFEPAKY